MQNIAQFPKATFVRIAYFFTVICAHSIKSHLDFVTYDLYNEPHPKTYKYTSSLQVLSWAGSFIEKCLNFLKRSSANNFVSYHAFDYPQGLSVGKKHSNQFLASLSGRLHKVDIICRFAKTRFAQTLAKRHNVLLRSPRKRSTKQIKWCFLSPRTAHCGLSNLEKT